MNCSFDSDLLTSVQIDDPYNDFVGSCGDASAHALELVPDRSLDSRVQQHDAPFSI